MLNGPLDLVRVPFIVSHCSFMRQFKYNSLGPSIDNCYPPCTKISELYFYWLNTYLLPVNNGAQQ
jgi:hypothetical protein